MANTTITMEREHTFGLEETIAEAPKRKTYRWIAWGLAAIALATTAGISIKYSDSKPEESAKPATVIVEPAVEEAVTTKKYEIVSIQVDPEERPYFDAALAYLKNQHGQNPDEIKVYSYGHITGDMHRLRRERDKITAYIFLLADDDSYSETVIDLQRKVDDSFTSTYFPTENEKRIIRALENLLEKPLFVRDVRQIKPEDVDSVIDPFFRMDYPDPVSNELYRVSYVNRWDSGARRLFDGDYFFDFRERILFGHLSPL